MPSAATQRPRLIVVYGHRALDALQVRAGARGLCDVIWLIDPGDPSAQAVRPLLERSGAVVARLDEDPRSVAAALRPHEPDGIVTFYDTGMEHVAEIAGELGLPFHAVWAGRALEDKLAQREALRAGGLPTPEVVALPADADRATVERLAGEMSFPVVLKPRRASGSWHTFTVADVRELCEVWDAVAAVGAEPMIAEGYLSDGPPMPAGFEAGYVSVESVVVSGRPTHVATTGRFPLVEPMRETGFFIPSTLGDEQIAEVLALADETLRALGFEVGCAHTEIKLTDAGPRVIEVNGRIGGGVPEMLRLSTGLDLVAMTMAAALGSAPAGDVMPATNGIGYRFFYQPPSRARQVVTVDGIDELRALPGVESVRLHRPPGTPVDAREGTRAYVFALVGWAEDLDRLRSVEAFLREEISVTYAEAPPDGG